MSKGILNNLGSIKELKHPLNVVVLLAALIEVAATVVLPTIEGTVQSIFVWFVMIFPFFLTLMFFATLNFNRKVFLNPGDFQDQENFLKLYGVEIASVTEVIKKRQRIVEGPSRGAEREKAVEGDEGGLPAEYEWEIIADRILLQLEEELSTTPRRYVKLGRQESSNVLDAIFVTKKFVRVVEVVVLHDEKSVKSIKNRFELIAQEIDSHQRKFDRPVQGLVAIGYRGSVEGMSRIRKEIEVISTEFRGVVDVRYFPL